MKNAFNPFLEEERKIFALRREEVLYNARYKYYEDECGELHLMQRLVAERPCFNPDRAEQWRRKASNGGENRPADIAAYQLENMSAGMADALEAADAAAAAANTLRAQRRAKARIFDLALCNYDFKYFVTWTLSADKCDRYDYKAIVRNLGQWLDNRVRRSGLKYLIVPELHKDGAVHFHGLTNDAISVMPSDTWVHPDTGRPVKLSTLRRQHIAPADCQPVYNLADWQRIHFTASKTGKSGSKRISAQLAKQLRQIAGAVYIFEHRTDPNKHRTRQAVWRDVKSAAAACSIRQNAAPHSARKTYAVEVFHSGGLPAARKELQHNSYGTTLLYALSDKFGSVPALGAAGEETPPAFRLSESDIESIASRVAELVLDELKRNGVFHPSHQ